MNYRIGIAALWLFALAACSTRQALPTLPAANTQSDTINADILTAAFSSDTPTAYAPLEQLAFETEWHDTAKTAHYQTLRLSEDAAARFPALAGSLDTLNDDIAALSSRGAELMGGSEESDTAYEKRGLYVKRADAEVFSLLVGAESCIGSGRPVTHCESHTYDTASGMPLTITDVLTSTDELPALLGAKLKARYDGGFLDDPEETLRTYITSEDAPLVWTLSGEGITFWFESGTVASRADGTLSATVLFSEAPKLFAERFCTLPDSYVLALGEGEIETIRPEGVGNALPVSVGRSASAVYGGSDIWTVRVGDHVLTEELTAPCENVTAYVIRENGRQYLLAELRDGAYTASLKLYDLTAGIPTVICELPETGLAFHRTETGLACAVPRTLTSFELSEIVDLLGTTVGTRTYSLVGGTRLRTDDTTYDLLAFGENGEERTLTTKYELLLPTCDSASPEQTGEEKVVLSGTRCFYVSADTEGHMVLLLHDGTYVRLDTDAVRGTLLSETVGGVDAHELFDGIWYRSDEAYAAPETYEPYFTEEPVPEGGTEEETAAEEA